MERSVIDDKGGEEVGEEGLEDLPSVWDPVLGEIDNDYVAGIRGIFLTLIYTLAIFYVISHKKE